MLIYSCRAIPILVGPRRNPHSGAFPSAPVLVKSLTPQFRPIPRTGTYHPHHMGRKKKAMAIMKNTPKSWAPSIQLLSPSWAMSAAMSVPAPNVASSKG